MTPTDTPALIALDFDGTLIDWRDGGPYVSPETREAIGDAIARGIHVGLCSGRRWLDMRHILEGLGMPWGRPFPTFVVALEKFVYWMRDGHLREEGFAGWNRERAAQTDALARACLPHAHDWLHALSEAGLPPVTWHVYCDYGMAFTWKTPEDAEQGRRLLCELSRGVPDAHVNRNVRGVYVVPVSGSKGLALRRLAEELGIPPRRVLGVGDSLNDLDMVDGRHGLAGATMANGDPVIQAAVRAAGGYVASAPSEAGVGEIIRRCLRHLGNGSTANERE